MPTRISWRALKNAARPEEIPVMARIAVGCPQRRPVRKKSSQVGAVARRLPTTGPLMLSHLYQKMEHVVLPMFYSNRGHPDYECLEYTTGLVPLRS
jgi:hypothetical protein